MLHERAIALLAGLVLDALLGDPRWMPHPVVAMGRCITFMEKHLRRLLPKTPTGEKAGGAVLAVALPLLCGGLAALALLAAGYIHPLLRIAVESWMCYQILATKCLAQAGAAVFAALAAGDINAARKAVGMVVGRDPSTLNESAIIRATVETIAENTSDGVIAPMFCFLLGGAPLAIAYKAVNTMDSLVGYKNEKYLNFGRFPARLDDAANWLPARLTGLLTVAGAAFGFDAKNAFAMMRRDARLHLSPNSGFPEAACAGALGIQLGGDSVYFGRTVHKQTLGDARRLPEAADIKRATSLMIWCTFIFAIFAVALLVAAAFIAAHIPILHSFA